MCGGCLTGTVSKLTTENMKLSIETMREVWVDDDPESEHYEIGRRPDDLGCVEIRCKDRQGKVVVRMSFPPELAIAIADAMKLCAAELHPTN